MSDETKPLDDDRLLAEQAAERLAASREAQLLASLIRQLRARPHPWWAPSNLRRSWPSAMRFEWLAGRPDVRGRLTHQLTGLAPAAARNLERTLQVQLVDRVVDAGDVTAEQYELAYTPEDLAIHAPAATIWQEVRSRFPWDAPRAEDLEFLGWFLKDLMAPRAGGPLLSALYVRSAIDVRVWHESLPIEVRVQADARRLQFELAGKPFTSQDELAVVKVDRLVQYLPARSLRAVFDAVEQVLPSLAGFSDEPPDLDPAELEPVEN